MSRAGDNVVLHWRKGAGIESAVPAYAWKGRKLNAGWITTFNRHAVVVGESRHAASPPEAISRSRPSSAARSPPVSASCQNNARVRIGESVVVFGAGGVGLNIVQAAALVSAYPVIAVDLYDNRLALASQMGATHVINAKNEDALARIRAAWSAPAAWITSSTIPGSPRSSRPGTSLREPKGRVTLVGVPRKGTDITIYSLPLHFGKALSGSHGGETVPEQDIPRYHELFTAGRIKLRELVTETRPLNEINTAIERMRDGSVSGRCLIHMKHET